MNESRFVSAADLFDGWREAVLSGAPPVLYPAGLDGIEIGPGLVTLIGGAPGAGKSALVMQLVFEALARTPTLRALICNIEMPASVLLDRQLARLSGIDLTAIRHRRLTAAHGADLGRGLDALEHVAERLAFVRAPFNLANVAGAADAFDAGLIVLDYIQRIGAPGEHGDRRGSVDAMLNFIRQFADVGLAVVVVAALARSKDSKGRSSYSGEALSLASFRETSELEYGSDDAFILAPDDDAGPGRVRLMHLKSRNGECRDIALHFDRPRQRFTPVGPVGRARPKDNGKILSALQRAWEATRPAHDDGEGDH